MYVFKELRNGAQVFVVCPLVEESEAMDVRSAEQTFESLKRRFAHWSVELLRAHEAAEKRRHGALQIKKRIF